ncbi:hypothetical protein TNCV_1046071 [Trichonephila clavipes]|nr:hypothetical protein TNCV_1046071 [Trichonephila clavipes]
MKWDSLSLPHRTTETWIFLPPIRKKNKWKLCWLQNERLSFTPHLLLLRSRILKRNTRVSENSASCTEFIIDIMGMTSLDNYVFNAAEKDRYYTGLMEENILEEH